MVRNSAMISIPPESRRRPSASLRPIPVRETIPTIMPAMAQAAATPIVFFAPFSKDSTNAFGVRRVSFRNMLTIMEARIARHAAREAVYPIDIVVISTTIGKNRYPLLSISLKKLGIDSFGSPFSPSFLASK